MLEGARDDGGGPRADPRQRATRLNGGVIQLSSGTSTREIELMQNRWSVGVP